MAQPLTDAINALTRYANEVTGADDPDLSSAVATLASGWGGSGGASSYVPIPNKPLTSVIESLTAYANEVTGADDQTLSDAVRTLCNGYSKASWTDYVQDGLEIIWDGIQNTRNGHEQTPTKWENLAGSSFDMANHNVVFEDSCAVFTGSEYCKTAYTGKQYQTVEFVIKRDGNTAGCVLFKTMNTNYTANGFSCIVGTTTGNMLRFITGTRNNTRNYFKAVEIVPDVIESLSGVWQSEDSTADIYINGSLAVGEEGNQNWGYGNYIIGGYDRYNPPNNYFYRGRIYCIRLYTRTLTEAEVLQNYAVDKARFGI